jgi:hypothetical protein
LIKTCSYVSRSSLTIREGCSFPVIELFDISGCNQAKMVPEFQKFLLVSMLVKTVPTFVDWIHLLIVQVILEHLALGSIALPTWSTIIAQEPLDLSAQD